MTTVSDFIVRRLSGWGIKRVYGYPGDGIKEPGTWNIIKQTWKEAVETYLPH